MIARTMGVAAVVVMTTTCCRRSFIWKQLPCVSFPQLQNSTKYAKQTREDRNICTFNCKQHTNEPNTIRITP